MRYSIDILKQKLSGSIAPTTNNVHSGGSFAWSFNGLECTYCMLPIDEMYVDDSYQRDIKGNKKIEIISKEFNPVECGVLLTGKRDGKYYIVDGQHRYLSAKIRGDVTELPCLVFESESAAYEAQLFNRCNSVRTNATVRERFKAMVYAGEKKYVECAKIIEECGYVWKSSSSKAPNFASFSVILSYYDKYGVESLKQALTLLRPTVHGHALNNLAFTCVWGVCAQYTIPDYDALKEQIESKTSIAWGSFIQSMMKEPSNKSGTIVLHNYKRSSDYGTALLADYLNTKLKSKSRRLVLKETDEQ